MICWWKTLRHVPGFPLKKGDVISFIATCDKQNTGINNGYCNKELPNIFSKNGYLLMFLSPELIFAKPTLVTVARILSPVMATQDECPSLPCYCPNFCALHTGRKVEEGANKYFTFPGLTFYSTSIDTPQKNQLPLYLKGTRHKSVFHRKRTNVPFSKRQFLKLVKGYVIFQPSIFRGYCWWLKSCTSWAKGSLSHYFLGFLTFIHPTKWWSPDFFHHQ